MVDVMDYIPRVVDSQIRRLVEDLPAVVVDGPKAVGKTATSQRIAASVIDLMDDDELDLTRANPARIEGLAPPVLIDEWQRLPSIWNRVRGAVDAGAAPGSYILTGSASVATGKAGRRSSREPGTPRLHSGAGRVVRVRMRPMALAERGLVTPSVSLAGLLSGARPDIGGSSPVSLADYADQIAATGFPGIRTTPERSRRDVIDAYLATVVEREFPEAGHAVRRPVVLTHWLRAYAAATSTAAAYADILDAATPGIGDKPARSTVEIYRETLERLWLLDELPAWPGLGPLGALAKSPRHHLADPGLAARLLGVGAGALLDVPNPDRPVRPRRGTLFGSLFESLATLCVRVYSQASGAEVTYLRTEKGTHEVDLIVARDDGRILPIEVKLAATVTDAEAAHLRWLRAKLPDEVVDAAVLTTGKEAYRRADGIAVIPLALLGP
jgi:predicted AAA+ superfamily ATPase